MVCNDFWRKVVNDFRKVMILNTRKVELTSNDHSADFWRDNAGAYIILLDTFHSTNREMENRHDADHLKHGDHGFRGLAIRSKTPGK